MTTFYPTGSNHCCMCAGVCQHIGGPYYCANHDYYRFNWHPRPYVWPLPTTTNTLTFYSDRPYVGRRRKGDPEQGA